MGKKKESRTADDDLISKKAEKPSSTIVDPKLAALFSSSVYKIPRALPSIAKHASEKSRRIRQDDTLLSETREVLGNEDSTSAEDTEDEVAVSPALTPLEAPKSKKRKRTAQKEEIEDKYLRRLALEEQKELAAKRREERVNLQQENAGDSDAQSETSQDDSDTQVPSAMDGDAENEHYEIPKHESLAPSGKADDIDKAARTVFLGNVSTLAIKSKASKKVLLDHLGSFFDEMKNSKDQSVESIRFRSTAFSDGSLPKKAAFAKRELMDATTQCTNAYVVYSTTSAAREAVKTLNGTIILDRHLRVDSVTHPSAIDHRRCVFVGNLGFVDDESNIRANEVDDGRKRPKAKAAADVEEGLWVHFAKAGSVESVRVVRDRNTRVGKGIAYVQFKDPNSVEKALSFNEKKFPPMLPRKLRVTRARKLKKSASSSNLKSQKTNGSSIYKPKQSAHLSSLAGRANRLLGRAGGHHVRKRAKLGDASFKSPEDVVFEGHRAVPSQGSKPSKEEKKKRRDRRTNRSSAYRTKSNRF